MKLNDFEEAKKIGNGTFSIVYSARHIKTGINVAIKSINKALLSDPTVDRNFCQELSTMKKVDHPNIIHFYCSFDDDRFKYIVMELANGGSLLNYLNTKGKMSEDNARVIFQQILSVLKYLHREHHVIHRDIKMENILFSKGGTIRVIDFGLSGQILCNENNEKLLKNTQCGSFPYAAPEIFTKQPYDEAVDMWSAGVILYSIVAGEMPFMDNNSTKLIQRILNDEPIYSPKIFSPELSDLLRHLLDKNCKRRYTVEKAMNHPWTNHNLNYNKLIVTSRRFSYQNGQNNSLLQNPKSVFILNNSSNARNQNQNDITEQNSSSNDDDADNLNPSNINLVETNYGNQRNQDFQQNKHQLAINRQLNQIQLHKSVLSRSNFHFKMSDVTPTHKLKNTQIKNYHVIPFVKSEVDQSILNDIETKYNLNTDGFFDDVLNHTETETVTYYRMLKTEAVSAILPTYASFQMNVLDFPKLPSLGITGPDQYISPKIKSGKERKLAQLEMIIAKNRQIPISNRHSLIPKKTTVD